MKTIWKFPLGRQELTEIEMPKGARVIGAGLDIKTDNICLWAEVDSDSKKKVVRTFYIMGTGHEFPKDKELHLITSPVFAMSGVLVFHVYEVI